MADLIIRGAHIIDGSGKPAYKSDLAIDGERIAWIGESLEAESAAELDVGGLYLAPGFIDPHTHSDMALLARPVGESKIRQGVTTEVVGNCGFSAAPLGEDGAVDIPLHGNDLGVVADWRSMAGYIARVRGDGCAVNMVALVGHNTLRNAVMGAAARKPTPEEQEEMEQLLLVSLKEGAQGFSTGLVYVPGAFASLDEIIRLAQVVAREGGIYTTHMRDESDDVIRAVEEALEVARRSGVRLQISHLKIIAERNWGRIDHLLQTVEGGLAEGLDLACDQYPYNASSTRLSDVFPPWVREGGADSMSSRLLDPEFRERIRQSWNQRPEDWDSLGGVVGWDGVLITEAPGLDNVAGNTIAELAARENVDPFDVTCNLVAKTRCQVGCVFFDQSPEVVRRVMRHPSVVVGSDGASFSPQSLGAEFKPHPRSYGTFPRILGQYVREEGILTLEEAIRKMTSATARHFHLSGRGEIRIGAFADLVLFDPERVSDQATFDNPHQFPRGIPHVFVNGVAVIRDEQYTGALPGRVL